VINLFRAVWWTLKIWPEVDSVVVRQRPNFVSTSPSRIFYVRKER